ncbi:MAG: hypothetical protein MUE85_13145 [Microscillaceae bacterium]|jgi:hypothetical protein|nr:hypothetical protein [Microscillaceae bacterium]
MSEFQIYQFRAIDRPLTDQERAEVSSWSSRTRASSYGADFTYSYGDFPKDEEAAVEQYFDLMLYLANWGTRKLILRFPLNSIDAKAIRQYTYQSDWSEISLQKRRDCYLLTLSFGEEGGSDWLDESEFSVDKFNDLRQAIINGDYRGLYILWVDFCLAEQEYEGEAEDEYEEEDEQASSNQPEIPANMPKILPKYSPLIDFFQISQDLVTVLQTLGGEADAQAIDYPTLLSQLSEKEKEKFLLRFLQEEPQLLSTLKKQLISMLSGKKQQKQVSPNLKTFNELIDEAKSIRLKNEENARQAAHRKKMNELKPKKLKLWQQVELEIDLKNASGYNRAVEILKDLKQLALFEDEMEGFKANLTYLKSKYSRSASLMDRFKKAGLE